MSYLKVSVANATDSVTRLLLQKDTAASQCVNYLHLLYLHLLV